MGSFQETASRKTAENTVKHRDGGVGLVVANHRSGSESSVVVRTLKSLYFATPLAFKAPDGGVPLGRSP